MSSRAFFEGPSRLWMRSARRALNVVGSLLLAAPVLADPLDLNPNNQKYAERNPAATGRSGTASLAARALIDKEDQTLLEMTTGVLDSAEAPPGRIVKAQVKAVDAQGEAVFTLNYNGLESGYVGYTYQQLRRGQPLQVQASVRGVDGARTDVVTVSDLVRARPDLAVQRLDAPEKGVARTPVNISAMVAELNGDVGARADCLLYVDGAEVDGSVGIWVDSGDAVSCAFTHEFETPGQKALKVVVSNVTPGDWDLENNSADTAIEIVEAYDRVEAGFSEDLTSTTATARGSYNYVYPWSSSSYDFESRSASDGWRQASVYRAWIYHPITFPVDVEASLSDGAQEGTARFTGVALQWRTGNPDGWCSYGEAVARSNAHRVNLFVGACSVRGKLVTILDVQRYAGVVTYFSAGFSRSWYRYANGQTYTYQSAWSYNFTATTDGTQRLSLPYINQNMVLTSAGVVYERSVDVVVDHETPIEWNSPETCSSWNYSWGYSGWYCSSSAGSRRVKWGSVVVGSPDPRTVP